VTKTKGKSMKTNQILVSLGAVLVTLTAAAQPNPPAGPLHPHVEGELLVKFRGGSRGEAAEHARVRMKHEVKRHFDTIGWQQIRLPQGLTAEEALTRYQGSPGVTSVELNGVVVLGSSVSAGAPSAFQAAGAPSSTPPDDPRYPQQWALTTIDAPNAWTFSTGSTNVVVADFASGINYLHEDLAANVWRNPGEIPGNGIDDDANGYIDDVHGIDTASNDSDPIDEGTFGNYIGTSIAGLIGAVGNNGKGVASLLWSTRIMAVRIIATNDTTTFADLVEGLNYVTLMKRRGVNIRVTNHDYGWNPYSQVFKDALDAAAAEGMLHVCIAHNAGVNIDAQFQYPPCYDVPRIISVAASDQADNLATGSSWGRTNVDLAAPGTGTAALDGKGTNTYHNSVNWITGVAGPLVAGAAALLFAANPDATADQVKAALLETVDVSPGLTNKMVSHGRLNIARAMYHPAISSNKPPLVATPPPNRVANEGTNTNLTVAAYGTPPLSYEWRKQGQPLGASSSATLSLTNLTTGHEGDYSVVVSNAFGVVTSAVGTLTVRTFPRLVRPVAPIQLTAVPGETVTLSVETTGTLPIGYRWRFLRTNGLGGNLTNFVLHQHTCFLTLTVDSNSAGSYTIVLTNAAQPTSTIQRTNAVLTVLPDSDGDGLPDAWKTTYPTAASGADDTDLDGLTNLQEYRAGTDPTNALSYLRVDTIALAGESNLVSLSFLAASNKTYTIQHRNVVDSEAWNRLADVLAAPTNRVIEILDTNGPPANPQRYYRLVTPRSP
jgi:subtilisin family serine protease